MLQFFETGAKNANPSVRECSTSINKRSFRIVWRIICELSGAFARCRDSVIVMQQIFRWRIENSFIKCEIKSFVDDEVQFFCALVLIETQSENELEALHCAMKKTGKKKRDTVWVKCETNAIIC